MSYPITFSPTRALGDEPMSVQELLNMIASCLQAEWQNPSGLILGQMGGSLPTSPIYENGYIAPWDNNGEWWFWNGSTYARGIEGVPIGMIAIWAGQSVPANWLLCDGSEVSIQQYGLLHQVLGTYWGGDGVNTFGLPVGGGVMYMASDNNFVPDPLVMPSLTAEYSQKTYGFGIVGGLQVAPLLTAQNMPQLFAKVTFAFQAKEQTSTAKFGLSMLQPPTQSGESWTFQVTDTNGQQLNTQLQTQFSTMPPFAAANYIIKAQ